MNLPEIRYHRLSQVYSPTAIRTNTNNRYNYANYDNRKTGHANSEKLTSLPSHMKQKITQEKIYNAFEDPDKLIIKDSVRKSFIENIKKEYHNSVEKIAKQLNHQRTADKRVPEKTPFEPTVQYPFLSILAKYTGGKGKAVRVPRITIYLTEEDYKNGRVATKSQLKSNPYTEAFYLHLLSRSTKMHFTYPYWDDSRDYNKYGHGSAIVCDAELSRIGGVNPYIKYTSPGKLSTDQINFIQAIFYEFFTSDKYYISADRRSKRDQGGDKADVKNQGNNTRDVIVKMFKEKIGNNTYSSEASWNAAMRTIEKDDPSFMAQVKQTLKNNNFTEESEEINGKSDFDNMAFESLPEVDQVISDIIKEELHLNDTEINDLTAPRMVEILTNLGEKNKTKADIINTVLLQNEIDMKIPRLSNVKDDLFYQRILDYTKNKASIIATISALGVIVAGAGYYLNNYRKRNTKKRIYDVELNNIIVQSKEMEQTLIESTKMLSINNAIADSESNLDSDQLLTNTVSEQNYARELLHESGKLLHNVKISESLSDRHSKNSGFIGKFIDELPELESLEKIRQSYSTEINYVLNNKNHQEINKTSNVLDSKFNVIVNIVEQYKKDKEEIMDQYVKDKGMVVTINDDKWVLQKRNGLLKDKKEPVDQLLSSLNECQSLANIEIWEEHQIYADKLVSWIKGGKIDNEPVPPGMVDSTAVLERNNNANNISILYQKIFNFFYNKIITKPEELVRRDDYRENEKHKSADGRKISI